MIKKPNALDIATFVLFLAGLMDMVRGYMHTFQVRYAAENLAGVGQDPDELFLLGAFGVSNFLTGLLFFLIIWKARHLVPYVLFVIPISYAIGGAGISFAEVQPEAPFRGQHMMRVYLLVCFVTSLYYFTLSRFKRNKTIKSQIQL